MTSQMIRPSQFILVYGPGAILEGRRGPRVIPGLSEGLFGGDMNPEDFEIQDGGMLKAALGGKRIFNMPSKEMMETAGVERPYRTAPFPRWRMCVNASGHEGAYLLYHSRGRQSSPCPACGAGNPGATRFVMACPGGHMDEVNWHGLVHGGNECGGTARGLPHALSRDDTFYYRSSGPISSVVLECPRCGAKGGLRGAYGRWWRCSGREPESEPPGSRKPRRPGCTLKSRIIHRQASNLRVPVVETHFTTGPHVTGIHVCMLERAIRAALFAPGRMPPRTREEAMETFEWLHKQGMLSADQMYDIRDSDWEVLKDAIDNAREEPKGGFEDMISGEFRGLLDAAENGAPPERRADYKRVLFEVERGSTRGMTLLGRELRVTPVKRLRTITAQTGFRRMIAAGEAAGGPRNGATGDEPAEVKEVDISFDHNGHRWYPGVEFLGEGLFITAVDDVVRDSKAAREWRGASKDGYDRYLSQHGLFRELGPAFVWWHTLSHALTRAIGEHAGYSSASIRERVYVEGRRGGILLYATQPGNDGTLGGLISLAPHIDQILPAAMEGVRVCSGDPLCRRQEFKPGDLNGAACYGCLMNSETSCEHRNMWLDRHVLLDDLP